MPIPLALAIPAGVALASKGIDALQTRNLNKKNREFAVQQADKARQQALDDFNATNAFNAPSAQKQRYINAGLNPAMMYGGGPAPVPSTVVRGTAPAQNTQTAMDMGVSNILPMLSQIKLIQAQAEGIQLDNAAKLRDLENRKQAQDEIGNPEILKSQLVQLELQKAVRELQISRETTDAQIRIKLNEALNGALQASEQAFRNENLLPLEKQKAEQDLEMLKIAIQQGQSTATIARMNAELAQKGIYPTDPVYLRQAIILLNKYMK